MAGRRAVRFGLRLTGALVVLAIIYVGITFIQVWNASRSDGVRAADAIVVLGAAQYDGTPSPVLEERLSHAFDLWEAGFAETVVVTGGRQEGDRFTEATASYNYLRERGMPDELILREKDGTNTWEQLAASARFLKERQLLQVLLVTDDYHAYRVEAIARDLGLEASVSPTSSGREGFAQFRSLAKETVAVSLGRFIGYRRLVDLDDAVERVRDPKDNG